VPVNRLLRLGTRSSALARWQAEWVAARLRQLDLDVTLVPIATSGDRDLSPIGTIGGQGVFTKELQRALLDGRIDLAVHSLKDLPTEDVPGLCLAAVPPRESPWDVLVSRRGVPLEELPGGAVVGTGSLRRQAQLLHARPELRLDSIRGNVDTRLRKLDAGQCEALVLAEAGLRRLGLEDRITQVLPAAVVLPAVGQGALGLETRCDDEPSRQAVGRLNDPASFAAVKAERAMLAGLRGGCLAPVAAWGRTEGEQLALTGRVLHPDGARKLEATLAGPVAEPESLGQVVAQALLAQGAADLIAAARRA